MIATMYCAVQQEASAINLTKDILSLFWSIDSCGPKIKQKLVKQAEKINRGYYLILAISGLMGIILTPIWGNPKDFFLCVNVYEYYFGKWAKIPYYVYFLTCPWMAFSSIRLPFMVIYAIAQIRMQVYLINQQIAEMTNMQEDSNYQQKILQKLLFCIKHHIMLKKWMRKLVSTVQIVMPLFVVLGATTAISVEFSIIYSFESKSFLGKIRIASVACCTSLVIYLFSEAGQSITNETTRVFDTLVTSPWNTWNIRNRKVLLIFMANSLEPMKFSLAGVTLDYKFAFGMLKTSLSYAIMLYKLNKKQTTF